MKTTSKCECGAELNYVITPFMMNEKRVCRECGRIHYVDPCPIDWDKICKKPDKLSDKSE